METTEKYLAFIDYLKCKINNEPISKQEITDFALDIDKETDKLKVNNKPALVLERFY